MHFECYGDVTTVEDGSPSQSSLTSPNGVNTNYACEVMSRENRTDFPFHYRGR